MKAIRMTATWCAPCSALKKALDQREINIEAIDIDENTEMATKYSIRSIPTILIVDELGTELQRFTGANLNQTQYDQLKLLSV